jgi:hypothetical protein
MDAYTADTASSLFDHATNLKWKKCVRFEQRVEIGQTVLDKNWCVTTCANMMSYDTSFAGLTVVCNANVYRLPFLCLLGFTYCKCG